MFRSKLATAAALLLASDLASARTLEVYVVDLFGNPVQGVPVQFARAPVSVDPEVGEVRFDYPYDSAKTVGSTAVASLEVEDEFRVGNLAVNFYSDGARGKEEWIGQIKEIEIPDDPRAEAVYAVPIWTPGEVNRFASAIVSDSPLARYRPTSLRPRVGVCVRYDDPFGRDAEVIARIDGDIDRWIARYAPDVPRVDNPALAWALYRDFYPGEAVPERFDPQMRAVAREASALERAARVCRRFPNRALGPPAPADGAGRSDAPAPDNAANPTPDEAGQFAQGPRDLLSPVQPLARVLIHNGEGCTYTARVNLQIVTIRAGGSTTVWVRPGRLATQVLQTGTTTRHWDTWTSTPRGLEITLYTHRRIPGRLSAAGGGGSVVSAAWSRGGRPGQESRSPFRLAQRTLPADRFRSGGQFPSPSSGGVRAPFDVGPSLLKQPDRQAWVPSPSPYRGGWGVIPSPHFGPAQGPTSSPQHQSWSSPPTPTLRSHDPCLVDLFDIPPPARSF